MKTVNKILSLILAVAMLLSVCSFSVGADEASVVLTDIDSSTTVGKAVTRLVSMGIINGYPDGTYKADNAITRAEFSVVMVKFLGMQDMINPDAITNFEDLDMDENYAWARPYVAMAVSRGIINGFEDGTFRAADQVTYEQAVKMLVCALGYGEKGKIPTIQGDWSSGYIAQAMRLGVTKGTSIANKTKATTRGVVAILTDNALETVENDTVNDVGDVVIKGDTTLSDLNYEEISGIVTGTFITELTSEDSAVPRNHIQIGDEIYEIGFSTSPYAFLGCGVKAVVYEDSDSDYPVIKSLELDRKTQVITVEADDIGSYKNGIVEYYDAASKRWKECQVVQQPTVIYNEKLDKRYALQNIKKDLVNGYADFIDNTGDGNIDIVRINAYELHVVYSKSSSTQRLTFMYESNSSFTFPQDSTALLFSLTRNGKEIQFKDIAKWDVLNIKASNPNASGTRFYEVVVTRDTASGMIAEGDDESIVINDEEYRISKNYRDLLTANNKDAVELTVGETVQVYLDAFGNVVAAAKSTSKTSSEEYAYLWSVRQEDPNSDYTLELWLYTTSGKQLQIGAADKVTIDGVRYKADNSAIITQLENAARKVNSEYPGATGYLYHQPIIYQTNGDGLVSVIHTVLSTENDGISMSMKNEKGENVYANYAEREYKSSYKSFTDFKVSSSTDIIFVPDNRGTKEDYLTFSSYSKAFANGRDYHVQAFGLTSSGTAALVLLYHQNDSRIYTSSSPWMIVASKSSTKEGDIIKGYKNGTSYSISSVTVAEDGPSIVSIGKGDIIRYIVDGNNKLIDYQIWFDASNPCQLQPVTSNLGLYDDGNINTPGANRIIEIHSTDVVPRKNYPTASFRLQYGTVSDLVLHTEGEESLDEEFISVSGVLREDGLEIDTFEKDKDSLSTMTKNLTSSVKVFKFDRSSRDGVVETEADLSEILPYTEYGFDATRVIIYSATGTLRMIYIITE